VWSFTRARWAARQVRRAPWGRRACATVRPRALAGVVRARAPLAVLLWIASRDGLVVEQDNGGFALLQPPAGKRPVLAGSYRMRLLRWLDRNWEFVALLGPSVGGLIAAAATAPFPATRLFALVAAVVVIALVGMVLSCVIAGLLGSMLGLGAPLLPEQESARSQCFEHWFVPLVHQEDPERVDELLGSVVDRLALLLGEELQSAAGDTARVRVEGVSDPPVLLRDGVTAEPADEAIRRSVRVLEHSSPQDGVVLLAPLARPDRAPGRWVAAGGFCLLYLLGLATGMAVSAAFIARIERQACAPAACLGRPASYGAAWRFLLHRLLFFNAPSLVPATTLAAVLGWLISLAGAMFILVAAEAFRQARLRAQQASARHEEARSRVMRTTQVLILVVTPGECGAVLDAARQRTSRRAARSQDGERTVWLLGTVGGSNLRLVQASDQGTATAAGMQATAREAIEQCKPDHVILTGICFGLRRERGQDTGDVILARQIYNIEPVKVAGTTVIRRGVRVGTSPLLLDRFQAGEQTWDGPPVHTGLVLTLNTLVNSANLVSQLQREFPDAIAGEMEAAGVYEAAMHGSKPDWIMVKAISDWGEGKTDSEQLQAARNAAKFVLHVIANSNLRRQQPSR
jgi:nucleoside phosphorylase